jgi:hypothetical protein
MSILNVVVTFYEQPIGASSALHRLFDAEGYTLAAGSDRGRGVVMLASPKQEIQVGPPGINEIFVRRVEVQSTQGRMLGSMECSSDGQLRIQGERELALPVG